MTIEEAIRELEEDKAMYMPREWIEELDRDTPDGRLITALEVAIKSLEAWEIIKDNLSQQIHHNLDVKENFEIGSTSRIECNTTASVLAGVIYLIDKHLEEVENG